MKFLVITHVPHTFHDGSYFAYGPYVKEMNLWFKHVDEVLIVAPMVQSAISKIDLPYKHDYIRFNSIASFSLVSKINILLAVLRAPGILWKIFTAMRHADHIHLRCPGNIGLLACLVQILFPNKPKTAKYAGNWDPKATQPLSYRLQKWILSNTFLTRKMQVLVYGEWEGNTKNIKPFFTATYCDSDKKEISQRDFSKTIEFLFVGTLSVGKRPLYAVQLVEQLHKKGYNVRLRLFGEGAEREKLETYIRNNDLETYIQLKGNQTAEIVKEAYQNSHFLVLLSKSEGWPKVVAEAMFWGCVPVSTPVSCVETMLGNGKRGLLLNGVINSDIGIIKKLLNDIDEYEVLSLNAVEWSRKFTLEYFESEIKKLLHLPNP